LIVCTNQSGIGRGFYSEKEFEALNIWMVSKFLEQQIPILDVFHCPHLPNENCTCRKPMPGMLIAAQKKHNICLGASYIIGDSESDILAGQAAGVKAAILLENSSSDFNQGSNADHTITSIEGACRYVN
jgi:D-glycero-D-manno-heptose 1,7-bisphosphate phosphatase